MRESLATLRQKNIERLAGLIHGMPDSDRRRRLTDLLAEERAAARLDHTV
jgi:hypothetical protein